MSGKNTFKLLIALHCGTEAKQNETEKVKKPSFDAYKHEFIDRNYQLNRSVKWANH